MQVKFHLFFLVFLGATFFDPLHHPCEFLRSDSKPHLIRGMLRAKNCLKLLSRFARIVLNLPRNPASSAAGQT
jgi:hypothetical protein